MAHCCTLLVKHSKHLKINQVSSQPLVIPRFWSFGENF